ncbi:MAG: GTPase HflX [Planctomycetes bacterium RBG_16_59_8]|nr:MAG: GTPase HflX [Planctomycetes bacterium RBG_16_59_8]
MKKNEQTLLRERAILVGLTDRSPRQLRDEDPLEEVERLVLTAGAAVVGKVIQQRELPDPHSCIGSGKVEEVGELLREARANVVVFDNDLTPAQAKNLEESWKVRVLDRTEVILDIFATHAQSLQAKLQVELAQLEYTLPRLRRMWTHLSRQEGGAGIGIGMRGPGEKQLEVDRRAARKRVTGLRRELREIEKRKEREVFTRRGSFTIALVGYTNAGKSTLMNALTAAGVPTEDKLFSTLDTRTRTWKLSSGFKILLSDTVGFIRNLPHHLVGSFHATLEEVIHADLLLHVVDAGRPDAADQIAAVNAVLTELGCIENETVMVFNKADRLDDRMEFAILENRYPRAVTLSALNGDGLDRLESAVEEIVNRRMTITDLEIPAGDGKTLAELAEHGAILDRRYLDGVALIRARLPERELYRYAAFIRKREG